MGPASYQFGFAPRDGSPAFPELWRGCIGAWAPLLGPTGLTLRDWSGCGNHGTLTNGATFAISAEKYAISLDGTDDIVTSSVSQLNSRSSGSIAFWCRKSASDKESSVGSRVTSTSGIWLQWYIDGFVYFSVRNGSVAFASYALTYTSKWIHLCGTFSGTTSTIYVNGVAVATGTANALSSTAGSQFSIGGLATGGFLTTGEQDDVRAYANRLSPSTVAVLASRRGIAYELAPRRRASVAVAFNRRRRLLVGAGT